MTRDLPAQFEEFSEARRNGFLKVKAIKENGGMVAGTFCTFTPDARIAPTPRSIQGELSCGMSLLVKQEDIDAVRSYLERSDAEYHSIVEMPCQIRPNRNRFC